MTMFKNEAYQTETQEVNRQNRETGTCTQCEKHCPLDQPGCGKGRKEKDGEHGPHGRGEKHRSHGWKEDHSEAREGHHGYRSHHRNGVHTNEVEEEIRQENIEDIGYLLGVCADHCNRRGGKANSQKRILHILRKKGLVAQSTLQEILEVKAGSLSELLSKMEAKGYIEKIQDETDKRKVMIHITEAGIVHSEEMHEKFHGKSKFDVLSEEEQATLKSLLKKILEI